MVWTAGETGIVTKTPSEPNSASSAVKLTSRPRFFRAGAESSLTKSAEPYAGTVMRSAFSWITGAVL